jgi:tetratricopeptide (TPR) repeat protein
VQNWRFIAPIGPIEAEDLRWYLEQYATSPRESDPTRARNIEEHLASWGQLLYNEAIPLAPTANVMKAWAKIRPQTERRFSILVNTALEVGVNEIEAGISKEVASHLLNLPWELLHDGDGYLFQGAKPMCVRRRLPNTRVLDTPVLDTPLRILLVTARPEDDTCSFVDHRASALPLVEAMEQLGGLVRINVLSPPTLVALQDELARAHAEKKPYHVIHFDGHGVYDHRIGLGALCFEDPQDVDLLERRRHIPITTKELRPLLRDYRIQLVFLGAFSSIALKTRVSECIASELLELGTVSVAVMSHNVLVETLRRFVQSFYTDLARGLRVGEGMLRSQRSLKDDNFRGRIFGMGDLRLEDWFIPVLYQEQDDPQLFKTTPAKQTQKDIETALATRIGDLPAVPKTGFIGRSRELLMLQRLLRKERYAVIRGQGGEGKTALASEFARWMVRSQQMRRAAFVSVEKHGNHRAVADALGKQLVKKDFSAAGDLEKPIQEIERALREQATLLVIDNMESVLLPPFMQSETPEALSQEAAEELTAILALCDRLLKAGETRVIFTSREPLPAPFDSERNRRELTQFHRDEAVSMVERVLITNAGASSDATREEIQQLVDAVHHHARTLALLAPSLRERGVESTRESLVKLMAQMEKDFPRAREKSLFASVELSLRRMSQENRERVRVLGVFHGAADMHMVRVMMKWEKDHLVSLMGELITTGLATLDPDDHVTFNPALCPYLRGRLREDERESWTASWIEAMHLYVEFLLRAQSEDARMAVSLTRLELPNLFAFLDLTQRHGDAEATIALATSLYELLKNVNRPRLLERVGQIRDAATSSLGDVWNHAQFEAARTRIEEQLAAKRLTEAMTSASLLLHRARQAGEQAYPDADYDLATAFFLSAVVLKTFGSSEQALLMLDEARRRFDGITKLAGTVETARNAAERMVARCLSEQGECLRHLGRLDEAVVAYEESIRRGEQLGDERGIAIAKGQIGSIRSDQGQYREALAALADAREQFMELNDLGSVALTWHQTGQVYQDAGELETAEEAYRESLAIEVRLENVERQATMLNQLGDLYNSLGRLEDAAAFFQQAVDKSIESGDVTNEGRRRHNLAVTLRQLGRFDEARQEANRAIECAAQFRHAAQPWKMWDLLTAIETETGNVNAAFDARRKAINTYLAYRRDGGENHDPEGQLSLAVTQALLTGDAANVVSQLQELAAQSDLPSHVRSFIDALQQIIAGSRDRSLAELPDLDYRMAAEILLLIETLEQRG